MKLSREKMFDWRWLNNQTKFYVFFRLLLMANFNDKPCELITIRRGQLMFSYESLSATLGVSVQTLRTTLRDLQKTNEINIQSTRRYSVLTICDYDSWQGDENETNIKSTYNQHTDNKQITLSEERNKEIKEENTNVLKKKCPETDLEQAFETFRRKYKKYGGSARGFETEFTNLAKKHKDWKEIIPMLDYALEEENKARQDALAKNEFFPQMKNLQTYINQRSWENYSDGWESYNPNAYHPQGLEYDDDFDAYRFYGGDPTYDLFDGYTNENRPDGARVVQQIFVYQWSALTRTWIKQ